MQLHARFWKGLLKKKKKKKNCMEKSQGDN